MLGRRRKDPAPPPDPATEAAAGGKGRPTPKRSEAVNLRKARAKPPVDRREAAKRAREENRAVRDRRRKALLAGDTRHLPRRDQGPVREYVRDFIDSRRSIAEFFIIIAVVVLIGSFIRVPSIAAASFFVWTLILVLIIVDSTVLGFRLKRKIAERFPDEERKGAIAYGLMRSTQLRRMRLPPPRVKPGATV